MCYYKNVAKPFLIGCGVAYSYMFGLAFMWESGLGPVALGEKLAHKINTLVGAQSSACGPAYRQAPLDPKIDPKKDV